MVVVVAEVIGAGVVEPGNTRVSKSNIFSTTH